ncbi:MAG: M23 family metallopeptidase [Candidatus Paceibacterota bacterium]
MKNLVAIGLLVLFFGFGSAAVLAAATLPTISVIPNEPAQGEPVMITVSNAGLNEVARIKLENRSLWFFEFKRQPTAFAPIDLYARAGPRKVEVVLENGAKIEKTFEVQAREKIEAPLGIPEKLGGDTPQAANNLVSNLTKENLILNNIFSTSKRYWTQPFRYPVPTPQITDIYGYLRKTGYYSIPHKGTDFKATVGTAVYPINRGIVRLAKKFEIYGNTIIVDHGLDVVSYYMHLSKMNVRAGELVGRETKIGLSGETGYALSPHLHLSIKISGVSIDPARFLEFFKQS